MEQDYSASLANTMVLGMYAVTEYYLKVVRMWTHILIVVQHVYIVRG
jgi:hypothetical protein